MLSEDVPEDVGRLSTREWNNMVGLRGYADSDEEKADEPIFMLLPSPAFQVRRLMCSVDERLVFAIAALLE